MKLIRESIGEHLYQDVEKIADTPVDWEKFRGIFETGLWLKKK